MIRPAFFRSPPVRALVERAATCAAVPVSVHVVRMGQEGPLLAGAGVCPAHPLLERVEGGGRACREARIGAGEAALRRDKPIPFVCHMGFACVATAALPGTGAPYALTLGPYCPVEAKETLDSDARKGLEALGVPCEEEIPFSLEGVRLVPTDAIPAMAEWTSEALLDLWRKGESGPEAQEKALAGDEEEAPEWANAPAAGAPAGTEGARWLYGPPDYAYPAGEIAAALAGRNQDQARLWVKGAIARSESGARVRAKVLRARAVALVAATLEAAERAGLVNDACRRRFAAFLEEAQRAHTEPDLTTAAMRMLSVMKRRAARPTTEAGARAAETPSGSDTLYQKLNELIAPRLNNGITLNKVARELGINPTAITHRLQRKFGLSFSEYVGRARVEKAKEILRRTRLDVGQVGRRVGIADTSNFCKLFRKVEGMAPGEYRARFGCNAKKRS